MKEVKLKITSEVSSDGEMITGSAREFTMKASAEYTMTKDFIPYFTPPVSLR
jgi:hypothetical protein